MPKKASLGPKTARISVPQKNGSVYIYERITQYDPEKKYNRVLSSRLIGKIPQGETDMVSTRGKNPPATASPSESVLPVPKG